jgi:hypothetical protein
MSAPEYLTWTGDPDNGINPYAPSVGDLGGTDKENDAEYPPEPGDPEASEWNQIGAQIIAASGMIPRALLDVRFDGGGVPFVYDIIACVNPELEVSDINCQDTATGKVTLIIPATKLPDVRWGDARPQATGDNTGLGYKTAAQTLVCEVRTAGALANVNFIAVWG